MSAREQLVEEIEGVVMGRLIWAVLPARHDLLARGSHQLADMVTWALNSVTEDIEAIVERYEVERPRSR